MGLTQDGRVLKIVTPLGKDYLLLNSISANEELSRPFSITAEVLHEETTDTGPPTIVDPKSILGKKVWIEVIQTDDTTRYFHGIVVSFEQHNRETRFTHFTIGIAPAIWVLSQTRKSRIFQQMSADEIIREILASFDTKYELSGQYAKRNYCVQYKESDLDFVSRLMEEEGIYYFFKHTNEKHEMVIADTPTSHPDCPSKHVISFDLNQPDEEEFVPLVREWVTNYRLQTGKITYWDHNFELPFKNLAVSEDSRFASEGFEKLETYDYPGGYARKFDGIDKGGGVQSGELAKVEQENKKMVKLAVQELDCGFQVFRGAADCSSMTSGHLFQLINHPTFSGTYILTSVSHSVAQSPDYASDDTVEAPYDNSFTCIVKGSVPFRPQRVTPRPVVRGSQTATVVGPSGEQIFTDKYGRVKVQFHWDREGQVDGNSSCWVRVAQSWAGNKWGTMFIPRIGMEVVVDFLEGDPDRPLIVGCVYNPKTMPPYDLPKNKTRSTIKTDSHKKTGGFNELRFEDEGDKEQIFIHAEKDLDIRVKNDCKEFVGNERHLIIKKDQFEKVEGDKHLVVSGNQNEKVGGSVSLDVGGSQQIKAGQKIAAEAGQEVHFKAGMTAVIEAGTSLTLKVGGNFVNINPGGVFVKGTMVMLNSGGAGGSGSGAKPEAPKDAKEAVDDKAGERASTPPAPVPPAPPNFAALAAAARERAQNPQSPGVQAAASQIATAAAGVQSAASQLQQQAEQQVQLVKQQVAKPAATVYQDLDAFLAEAEKQSERAKTFYSDAGAAIAEAEAAAKEKAEKLADKAKVIYSDAGAAIAKAEAAREKAKKRAEEAKEVVEAYSEAFKGIGEDAKSMLQSAQNGTPFF
jgi:type VI secretion system secreted protein VgrG